VGSASGAIAEILSRFTHPSLVIGVPAGLDGAAAAKDVLRASGVPCLSNVSEKGGPVVAAAAFGALLRVAAGNAGTTGSAGSAGNAGSAGSAGTAGD
jgi:precorrin isomerase